MTPRDAPFATRERALRSLIDRASSEVSRSQAAVVYCAPCSWVDAVSGDVVLECAATQHVEEHAVVPGRQQHVVHLGQQGGAPTGVRRIHQDVAGPQTVGRDPPPCLIVAVLGLGESRVARVRAVHIGPQDQVRIRRFHGGNVPPILERPGGDDIESLGARDRLRPGGLTALLVVVCADLHGERRGVTRGGNVTRGVRTRRADDRRRAVGRDPDRRWTAGDLHMDETLVLPDRGLEREGRQAQDDQQHDPSDDTGDRWPFRVRAGWTSGKDVAVRGESRVRRYGVRSGWHDRGSPRGTASQVGRSFTVFGRLWRSLDGRRA